MISIIEFLAKKHLNIKFNYFPKNRRLLINILTDRIRENDCDLNDIDISKINDMSDVFNEVRNKLDIKLLNSNNNQSFKDVDVSKWNVSHVENMDGMFRGCRDFNCDISNWDVSNVTRMMGMFGGCFEFDVDLENWKLNPNAFTNLMFYHTKISENDTYPSWFKGKK